MGTDFGRRADAGFTSGGAQISLKQAWRRWWRIRTGSGGRLASLCMHVKFVEEKQLVIHLQTRCQITTVTESSPDIDSSRQQP